MDEIRRKGGGSKRKRENRKMREREKNRKVELAIRTRWLEE